MSTVEPIRKISEIRRIEKYLQYKNKRDLLLFTLGINSGLRISDILALNIADVSNGNYIEITEKKTGKYKKFPINSKLKPMIQDYIKGKQKNSPLFLSKFGNRLDRIEAWRRLKLHCNTLGIESKIGTHTLRKTFGYHHYKKFKDVAMLQKILNHSTPQVTLRYIGIEQEEIENSYNNFIL